MIPSEAGNPVTFFYQYIYVWLQSTYQLYRVISASIEHEFRENSNPGQIVYPNSIT